MTRLVAVLLALLAMAGCGAKRTPLNDAIATGDKPGVVRLLDGGASMEENGACGTDTYYGERPLKCAIESDRPEIARLLVERGADIHAISKFGFPPLVSAASKDAETVKLLLDKGADINQRCVGWLEGRTALMEASIAGKTDIMKLLVERGAKVEARTPSGFNALYLAAFNQKPSSMKVLIAKGADIDHAISVAESEARKNKDNAEELAAARLLKELKEKFTLCALRYLPDPDMTAAFAGTAAKYRALPVKPALPEESRVFRLQAEDAVSRKRFQDAVDLYGKALKVSPWWPEGHFNQALILGESECPEEAIAAMERYLALVPDAPDAREARDKIYVWKGRLP